MLLNNHQDTYPSQSTSELAHGEVTPIVNVCVGNAFNLANVHDEVLMSTADQQVDQFNEQPLSSLFRTDGDVFVRSSIFDRQPQPQLPLLSTNTFDKSCQLFVCMAENVFILILDNLSINQQQLLVNNVDSPSSFSEQQQQVQINKTHVEYQHFKDSIPHASTPIGATQSIADPSLNSLVLSNVSNSEKVKWSIDPVEALKNPHVILARLLSKCKQILLSTSPIITKTCWNRRFGGDGNLCLSAIKLLMTADLLEESNFVTSTTNTYVSWMKKLPSVTNNISDTLEFQQMKLNIFNVTWQQYASSFKEATFGHSNRFSFVSPEAAEILRSKPYSDIGFILNESAVLTKKGKCILAAAPGILN
ncbi:unnamed protein product [Rotaria sp. Silwood2]|nr:unnamed protein product [Rotaria sp. Silwood2]